MSINFYLFTEQHFLGPISKLTRQNFIYLVCALYNPVRSCCNNWRRKNRKSIEQVHFLSSFFSFFGIYDDHRTGFGYWPLNVYFLVASQICAIDFNHCWYLFVMTILVVTHLQNKINKNGSSFPYCLHYNRPIWNL